MSNERAKFEAVEPNRLHAEWFVKHHIPNIHFDHTLAAFEAGRASLAGAAEPVAWSSGIEWHENPRAQSEQVVKLTRNRQAAHGFDHPLFAAPQPSPEQAPMTKERIAEIVRLRFASTNRTDQFSMYTYWYEKGLLDGWEEFKRGITTPTEAK